MKKVAFLFDTNFIVQNKKNLQEILNNLESRFVPYVTQVSIEERKSQKCKELGNNYKKAKELTSKLSSLVSLKGEEELNNEIEQLRKRVQHNYERLFNNHIIPCGTSSDVFEAILKRAYNKVAPFSETEKSDKGFKDTVLWLSMITYFKENGEDEILFLTDDNGFISKVDELKKEFEECTNKKIQIEKNSHIDKMSKESNNEIIPKKEIPNIDSIRVQLRDLLFDICHSYEYDVWDDECLVDNFSTVIEFDTDYIKDVLNELNTILQEHLFSETIKVATFLDKDERIYNDKKIEIKTLEKLHKLYEMVSENYPEHITAFITTITEKLNENFCETSSNDIPEVPF